jgi:hypothetical protein
MLELIEIVLTITAEIMRVWHINIVLQRWLQNFKGL